MADYLIQNAVVYTPFGVLVDEPIGIKNGRVAIDGDLSNPVIIDAHGGRLVPGFIDLQLNGGFGCDFTSDPESIWLVAAELPRYGVTSFLPTIITCPPATVTAAQQVLHNGAPEEWRGARPLGLHLEGPFFNPAKKGAHDPQLLREPSPAAVAEWSWANHVRLVTLAPELPQALETVCALKKQGVVVSAGHSMASYEQAQTAFAAGVSYGTHLFNAMPNFGHREPGLAGALLDSHLTTGLIADGVHVHPALVALAWQSQRCRLNLVTDAMAGLGMPPGQYQIGNQTVFVTAEGARLADGTLAGSILSLDEALRNLIEYTTCTLAQALSTVTSTPADLLDLGHERGRIADGYIADLVLLDDDLEVQMTFAEGELVYHRQERMLHVA